MASLSILRKTIDKMNKDIVDALCLRVRYPLCEDVYKLPYVELSDLGYCDGDYEGFDVWIPPYVELLRKVCKTGKPDKRVTMADFLFCDLPLFHLVIDRVQIGRIIAETKVPKAFPISDSNREQVMRDTIKEYGKSKGLSPHKVVTFFDGIIKWNKEVQVAYKANLALNRKVIRTATTACKEGDIIIKAAVAEMKWYAESVLGSGKFEEQDNYGVFVEERDGLTVVELVEL